MNVTPKTATLKIDGTDQTLTDGKLVQEVEFDKELALITEQEGFVKNEQTIKIEAKDNIVAIDLAKAKVRQFNHTIFISFFNNLFFVVQTGSYCNTKDSNVEN